MNNQLGNFYYLIFQAYPAKDKVYYWIDGDKAKRVMKRDEFIACLDKVPQLSETLHDAIVTTSFYIYDNVEGQITRLTPSASYHTYEYPLGKVLQKTRGGKAFEYDKPRDRKTTLNDQLNALGFQPLDDNSMKNLKVVISKLDKH